MFFHIIFETLVFFKYFFSSRYDFACSDDNLEKAACTACKIPRSLDKYVSIKLRGLCRKTHFDTIFEVNIFFIYLNNIGQKITNPGPRNKHILGFKSIEIVGVRVYS